MTTSADNLPPVEPPSPGFFVQLFVVPLVIVASIMAVIFAFQWLANMGTKPEALIKDLGKLNPGSWQKALTVANLLSDRRNAALRRDPQIAEDLASVLRQELDAGSQNADRARLRVYLCLTLGALEIDHGVPTLVRAATQEQGPADVEVRKTAIEALARLAAVSPEMKQAVSAQDDVWRALETASRAQASDAQYTSLFAQLRGRAAYAVGVLGTDRGRELLAGMLADADPATRYNAATGLARLGDERALPRLLEMVELAFVEPADAASPDGAGPDARADQSVPLNDIERTAIVRNGLRATVQLHQVNPQVSIDAIRQQVSKLASDPQLRPVIRRGIESDLRDAQQRLAP